MKLSHTQTLQILSYAKEIGIPLNKIVINGEGYKLFQKAKYNFFASFRNNCSLIDVKNSPYYLKIKSYNPHVLESHWIDVFHIPRKGYDTWKKRPQSFDQVFETIKEWLIIVKKELDAELEIKRLAQIPSIKQEEYSNSTYNEKLTQTEKEHFLIGLNNIKKGVQTELGLEDDKIDLIHEKLNELAEKIDTLGKFDLRSAFLGILLNLTSSVIYDQTGAFWGLVKNSFPNLIGNK